MGAQHYTTTSTAMHPFRPPIPQIRIIGFVGRNGCIALQGYHFPPVDVQCQKSGKDVEPCDVQGRSVFFLRDCLVQDVFDDGSYGPLPSVVILIHRLAELAQ